MNLRNVGFFVLTTFVLIFFAQQNSSGQEKTKDIAFLDMMITESRPLSVENLSASDVTEMLRLDYGCVINAEGIEYPRSDRIRVGGGFVDKKRPLVNRAFFNLTVRQILDELVRIDPGYHWKVYDGKYVVFEPRTEKYGGKEKSILDAVVSVSADNVPLISLLAGRHPFARELANRHRLSWLRIIMGRDPQFHKIPISIHMENVTLRDAFNAIVTAAEQVTGEKRYFAMLRELKTILHQTLDRQLVRLEQKLKKK